MRLIACTLAILSFTLALPVGCAHPRFAPSSTLLEIPKEGSSAVVTAASHRGTYVIPRGGPQFCAEPMPDTALDQTYASMLDLVHNGNVGVKRGKLDITIKMDNSLKNTVDVAIKSQQLAGRNATVLLARELLYRLCELSINIDPETDGYKEAAKNYLIVAENIKTLATAAEKQAEADKVVADTKKVEAETDKLAAKAHLASVNLQAAKFGENLDILIERLLLRVTQTSAGACTIDKDALTKTLADSMLDGIRDVLTASASCEDLRSELNDLRPSTLESMLAASEKATASATPGARSKKPTP